MMKDQMISFLAGEDATKTFENSDLRPPIRWNDFFIQDVSP
jgi:cytochrome b involved in lipid metabolism